MAARSQAAAEDAVRAIVLLVALASLALGGFTGFGRVFTLAGVGIAISATVIGIVIIARRLKSDSRATPSPSTGPKATVRDRSWVQPTFPTEPAGAKTRPWDENGIIRAIEQIDWYQFEKLNAAILSAEGWKVHRKGGAKPDGGKDLIAQRGGQTLVVQCKHWRTWKVKENVVRELIGSMSLAGISSGAIHTVHGFTDGARTLAESAGVSLHDASSIARRLRAALPDPALDRLLEAEPHFCPRCDSVMILRTGSFDPFLGCSRYPRCRGKIELAPSSYAAGTSR